MTPLLSAAAAVMSPFVLLHRLGVCFYFFLVNGCRQVQRGTEKEAGVSGGRPLVLYFGSLKEDANRNPPQMHADKKQTKMASLSRPSHQIQDKQI